MDGPNMEMGYEPYNIQVNDRQRRETLNSTTPVPEPEK